jgi:hypothetical protein
VVVAVLAELWLVEKCWEEMCVFLWNNMALYSVCGVVRIREWQWLGCSGINRLVRSVRFEWYKFQSGSGSIGRVAVKNTKSLG